MIKTFERRVQKDSEKMRLDTYLTISGIGVSRSKVSELIKEGKVKVNNKVIDKPSYKVKAGDHIVVEYEVEKEPEILPEDIEIPIVYEDEYIIVINKPMGIVVHPAKGHFKGTIVNAVLKKILEIQADRTRPGIVHRLDKDTSGLMVIAKTQDAVRNLAEQIQKRTMKRLYKAFVWGASIKDKGTIQAPIGRHPVDRKRMAITPINSKMAITHYRVIEKFSSVATLLELKLDTGRTHQIRVHMEYIGFPIIGDSVYSGRDSRKIFKVVPSIYRSIVNEILNTINRQALHAYKLIFMHPIEKRELIYETPLPDDMQKLYNILKYHLKDLDL
ncbi:MAG: RluA family pseudouridine synthase [candidate division WOR-3 bacterium]|nr:RluA family pseudouridine synthase [candidate division WOR-3 bacterium]MCX7948351.1 RluA family pseudouridine synthase [candidate division WOR-3 bacterium]MDW8151252.1 RluA family pseudouridine synthase [candidate division WOR-3 bacterium]